MKKLHMGTVSYGFESMDEVAHQLALAFGASEPGMCPRLGEIVCLTWFFTVGHGRKQSVVTGVQLAARGRRDMSSRVHDVVLSLALCHNVNVPQSRVISRLTLCDFRLLLLQTTTAPSPTKPHLPTKSP